MRNIRGLFTSLEPTSVVVTALMARKINNGRRPYRNNMVCQTNRTRTSLEQCLLPGHLSNEVGTPWLFSGGGHGLLELASLQHFVAPFVTGICNHWFHQLVMIGSATTRTLLMADRCCSQLNPLMLPMLLQRMYVCTSYVRNGMSVISTVRRCDRTITPVLYLYRHRPRGSEYCTVCDM